MSFKLDVHQIKEALNYGLVFTGPQFNFIYRKAWEINRKFLIYQGEFGAGPLTTRDMLGLNFYVKPVDLVYNVYERIRDVTVVAGPWLKMAYNYQLYPHLQSGYSYHFTNYTLGFSVTGKYQNDDFALRLQWKNSVAGLISRPPLYRDPYFFDLDISTYVKDQHKNFETGSFDLYNNTEVELRFVNKHHPRLGYAYTFELFSYNKDPKLDFISHSLSLIFYPKSVQ